MSDRIIKWWPIAVVAAGLVGSGSVDSFRLNAHAEDIKDLSESVDENEEALEEIQRLLIRRQGEVELTVQRIENDLSDVNEDLEEILRLLRQSD